jgi:hypothetical protein
MKTVFIWDEMMGEIRFFVVDGDFRHLDQTYINDSDDEDKLKQLNQVLDYDIDGEPKVRMITDFPTEEVKNGAFVVVAGFLP